MRLLLLMFLVCLAFASVRAELKRDEVLKLLKAQAAAGASNSKIAASIQQKLIATTEFDKNPHYSVHVSDARPDQFKHNEETIWHRGQTNQYDWFMDEFGKNVVVHLRPYIYEYDGSYDVQKKKLSERKKNLRKKLLEVLWSNQIEGNKTEIIRDCKTARNVFEGMNRWRPAMDSIQAFALIVPADADLASDYGEIPMDIRTVMPCGDTWYEVVVGFSGH